MQGIRPVKYTSTMSYSSADAKAANKVLSKLVKRTHLSKDITIQLKPSISYEI